jgi:hypothetical protein
MGCTPPHAVSEMKHLHMTTDHPDDPIAQAAHDVAER